MQPWLRLAAMLLGVVGGVDASAHAVLLLEHAGPGTWFTAGLGCLSIIGAVLSVPDPLLGTGLMLLAVVGILLSGWTLAPAVLLILAILLVGIAELVPQPVYGDE